MVAELVMERMAGPRAAAVAVEGAAATTSCRNGMAYTDYPADAPSSISQIRLEISVSCARIYDAHLWYAIVTPPAYVIAM